MNNLSQIYGAYRKVMARIGEVEILNGKLTDEEAQLAKRGINASKEDFFKLAAEDIGEFLIKNGHNTKFKLQIKAECDYDYNSYLIYLNFIEK